MERDSKIMEKIYVDVTEAVLSRPQKIKKLWVSEKSWSLIKRLKERK